MATAKLLNVTRRDYCPSCGRVDGYPAVDDFECRACRVRAERLARRVGEKSP